MEEPRLEALHEFLCRLETVGEDRRRQPELDRVRTFDRLVEGVESVEGRDGTEDLLARQHRVVGDSLEQRRRDEVGLFVHAFAACEHVPSLAFPLVDRLEHVVQLLLVDERTDLGLWVGWIADLAARNPTEEPLPELVVDRRLDVDTTRGGALLARGPERACVGVLDRAAQIGVRSDDPRVWPTELALHALAEHRRPIANLAADRDRAGEGDRPDLRMDYERPPDV